MARPLKTFGDFVGQERIVNTFAQVIAGAKTLGKPCPAFLLIAPSGFGKTAIAEAIASCFGSDARTLSVGKDTWAADICEMLFALRYGDIFFIDEAHSLNSDAKELLYIALDKHKAPIVRKGRPDRTQLKSLAEFTLVLATNEPGRIKGPLRSRVTEMAFDPYTMRELKTIAEKVARQEGSELTPQAARRLAEVAQGVPRSIARRVELLRYFFPTILKYTQEHVEHLLRSEGVDACGLFPYQRHYLIILAKSPKRSCSLERLAVKLGCDQLHVRQNIEPYLIDQGWVEPYAKRGRALTEEGHAIAQALLASLEEDSAC